MILNVPFTFDAAVIRGKKRLAERAAWRSSIDVRVADVSGADAPVALRFEIDHSDEGPAPVMEMRWFEGAHYAPFTDGEPTGHKAVNWLVSHLADPCHNFPLSPKELGADWAKEGIERSSETDVREIVSIEQESKIAEGIAKAAKDILIVDGLLWKTHPEPYFWFQAPNRNELSWVAIKVGYPPATGTRFAFRLDEAPFLLAQVPDLKNGSERVTKMPDVEVLIPECLNERFAERLLNETVKSALKSMARELPKADREYFDVYADLRDVRLEFETALEDGEPDVDALIAAFRRASGQEPKIAGWESERVEASFTRISMLSSAAMDIDPDAFGGPR